MDGMLSQEEINALLNGVSTESDTETKTSLNVDALNADEEDVLGEISNISMGTAATTLSTLVNHKVTITTPSVVSYSTWDDLVNDYDKPCVFIQISYREGLDGSNVLILKELDVKVITDLMMGGDGSNTSEELSELHLSAISEAMNQMMGSASTSISSMLDKKVDISPPTANLIDFNETIEAVSLSPFLQGAFVKVAFNIKIGDLVDSELMQLFPIDFARDLYKQFVDTMNGNKKEPVIDTPPQQQAPPQQQVPQQQMQQQNPGIQPQYQQEPIATMGNQQYQMPYPNQMGQPMNMPYGMMQDVNVQQAQFQQFNQNVNFTSQQENIDLIMDVPLEVTVELGRTNKSIKEILEFAPGTIIELNKIAGEPIDVLVNGKFVAKGEVVVIEESFGIRVTEIIR